MKRLSLSLILLVLTLTSCFSTPDRNTKALVILGGSWVQVKYLSDAAHSLGYRPVYLGHPNHFSPQVLSYLRNCECYEVDLDSYDNLRSFFQKEKGKLGPIAAITSLSDSKLPTAIQLAQAWNVPGPDPALLLLTNKAMVRKLIPEFSPKTLSFYTEKLPVQALRELIEQKGKLVVKPAEGAGGAGAIFLSHTPSEEELYGLLDKTELSDINTLEWLAQEYIEGTLYSVEGYVLQGKTSFIGLSRRSRMGTTEVANYFPADEDALVQPHLSRMQTAIMTLVERSGYKNGYFHTEFLVNPVGAYLIDANFGRMGGGALIENIAISFSRAPQDILRDILLVGVFHGINRDALLYGSPRKPSLSLNYGVDKKIHLQSIQIPCDLQSYVTVIAKEHTMIDPVGVSDNSWIGTLAGVPETVLEDIKQVTILSEENMPFSPVFAFEAPSSTPRLDP